MYYVRQQFRICRWHELWPRIYENTGIRHLSCNFFSFRARKIVLNGQRRTVCTVFALPNSWGSVPGLYVVDKLILLFICRIMCFVDKNIDIIYVILQCMMISLVTWDDIACSRLINVYDFVFAQNRFTQCQCNASYVSHAVIWHLSAYHLCFFTFAYYLYSSFICMCTRYRLT